MNAKSIVALLSLVCLALVGGAAAEAEVTTKVYFDVVRSSSPRAPSPRARLDPRLVLPRLTSPSLALPPPGGGG